MTECEFLFAALAEKHNAVIRKIREIPPWGKKGARQLDVSQRRLGLAGHQRH